MNWKGFGRKRCRDNHETSKDILNCGWFCQAVETGGTCNVEGGSVRQVALYSVNINVRPCAVKPLLGRAKAPAAPGSIPGQVMWDLWWTKWHCGRFSPSTSVSPANIHSTDCSIIIIYHPGLVQQANSGRRTKWTQSHHTQRN
jgi:hypothetical protein